MRKSPKNSDLLASDDSSDSSSEEDDDDVIPATQATSDKTKTARRIKKNGQLKTNEGPKETPDHVNELNEDNREYHLTQMLPAVVVRELDGTDTLNNSDENTKVDEETREDDEENNHERETHTEVTPEQNNSEELTNSGQREENRVLPVEHEKSFGNGPSAGSPF